MASPASFFFSVKIFLITTGALSIATALKFSVPLIMGFCLYDVPVLWNSLQTWLKPPYLYFITNGIIITIVACSRFSHRNHHQVNISAPTDQPRVPLITMRTPPPSDVVVALVSAEAPPEKEVHEVQEDASDAKVVELKAVVVNGIKQSTVDSDDDDGWIVPNSDITPSQKISSQDQTQLDIIWPVKEKPLALSRFGHITKPIEIIPPEGGRAVRVVARRRRPQQHDTLENTWKMISERRHVPITSQFQKSDTWENHGRQVVMSPLDLDLDSQRRSPRSATFRDRTNYNHGATVAPGCEMRKEPSLSHDEVNRRAEEFIKKFNEDMRLQRQESLKQYMEMINRGAC